MPTPKPAAQHFVLKLGTRIVSENNGELAQKRLGALIKECAQIWGSGRRFAIVSSGAIGLGRKVLGLGDKLSLPDKQASAAVGQTLLMRYYFEEFAKHGLVVAQVLVSAQDFSKLTNFQNLQRTLERLFNLGVIPILNENDSVATGEIALEGTEKSFGDNDALSAIIASKLGADLLILLTDVDGVYSDNPQRNQSAQKITSVTDLTELARIQTAGKSKVGRGGMFSKLVAAKMAAIGGCTTIIASGLDNGVLTDIFAGKNPGTTISPQVRLSGKKQWIGAASGYRGILVLNSGAAEALKLTRASVLAVGVTEIKGQFLAEEVVSLQNAAGDELARGISYYSSADARKMLGKKSEELKKTLGNTFGRELVHRDHLLVFS